mmetsp:Transcript_86218/g.279100  ORF Transcript_86218/g.279100 Transcript_86218/m.279100 type:complete len:213 (-) Transcript_86218:139-777(-)
MTCETRQTMSMWFLPGKSARRPRISARMHPMDQRSTADVYCFGSSITSGARYHRVTTYSVRTPQACSGSSASRSPMSPRARPKSHTFSLQSDVRRMFAGFRSRCATPAAWRCASARRICTMMTCTCFSVSACWDWMTLWRSAGMYGSTRKTSSKLGHATAGKSRRCRRFSWRSLASSRTSRRMLLPWRAAWRTCFTATWTPLRVSSQRCTVP